MTDGTDKEKWLNEVMNSTNGMVCAGAPPMLYENIISKIQRQKPEKATVIVMRRWAVAAAVLFVFNICSVFYVFNNKEKKAEKTDVYAPLASEMNMNSGYNY